MEYHTLGKTGLKVSVIGFGASTLGGAYGDLDEKTGIEAVHVAIESGINYFDTAPYYGALKSERVLGLALRGIPREKYYLATKVGRYGVADFDFSAKTVTQSVHDSLGRLGVDYFDIIQVHDIEFGDIKQVINETLPALHKLKELGLVKYIGVTGLPLKALHTVTSQVEVDIILSYCHYHLADSSLASYIPELKEKNIGIINASFLSMGLLTLSGPPAWHPAPANLKELCKKAAEHCKSRGSDISKLATKFALANKDIATNLLGLSTPEQVKAAIEAVVNSKITEEEQAILNEVADILKPVQGLTWPSGLPENN